MGCCLRIVSVFLQNLALQLKIMYVWYSCYLQMKDIQFYISRHIFPTFLYAPFPNDMKTNGRLFKLVKNRSITEYVKKKRFLEYFFSFTSCAAKQLLQLVLYKKKLDTDTCMVMNPFSLTGMQCWIAGVCFQVVNFISKGQICIYFCQQCDVCSIKHCNQSKHQVKQSIFLFMKRFTLMKQVIRTGWAWSDQI